MQCFSRCLFFIEFVLGILFDQFSPFYQPIVNSSTGRVVGCEALARWCRGKRTNNSSFFIPFAEKFGCLNIITSRIITRVIEDSLKIPVNVYLCINVTAAYIESGLLEKKLSALNWPLCGRIAFELVESEKVKNRGKFTAACKSLKSRGYQLKIDDFGTGYNSFTHLLSSGANDIKIDKSFVSLIGEEDDYILRAIIVLARKLKLGIVAEGVESSEQADFLNAYGVYFQQGYFYSEAMPVERLLHFISSRVLYV